MRQESLTISDLYFIESEVIFPEEWARLLIRCHRLFDNELLDYSLSTNSPVLHEKLWTEQGLLYVRAMSEKSPRFAPRPYHLFEKNVCVNGEPVNAFLLDCLLVLFHLKTTIHFDLSAFTSKEVPFLKKMIEMFKKEILSDSQDRVLQSTFCSGQQGP